VRQLRDQLDVARHPHPHQTAQEVEQFVTTPIELSLANIPDVTEIRSVSKLGLSVEKQVRYSGLNGVDVNPFALSL